MQIVFFTCLATWWEDSILFFLLFCSFLKEKKNSNMTFYSLGKYIFTKMEFRSRCHIIYREGTTRGDILLYLFVFIVFLTPFICFLWEGAFLTLSMIEFKTKNNNILIFKYYENIRQSMKTCLKTSFKIVFRKIFKNNFHIFFLWYYAIICHAIFLKLLFIFSIIF